jgi:hypothetical protein
LILAGLERAKLGWRDTEPEFVPHPATWLNQERWLDELPGATPIIRAVRDEDFAAKALEKFRQSRGLTADG